ncbi:hypothetical protein D3C79_663070 [compost metagenome]
MGRFDRLVAGVHQQEAAGAVGVLGLAGLHAHLAEQRGLLVASDTGNGDTALGAAVDFRGAAHFGQHLPRDVQHLEHLLVPLKGVDVEEHGARGVGVVGDVHLAAGEFPDQPAVDGTEQQIAALGALTSAFDIVEDPLELGAGEVRVGDQAGGFADVVLQAVTLELFADLGAAPALPDDGVVHRTTGFLVPHHGGFTLVGDTDGGYLVVAQACLGQGFDHGRALGGEDFHRVVLDPAGLWVMLCEFALRGANHVGITVENDGPRTGRALVQGNDVVLVLGVCHVVGLALNRVEIRAGRAWLATAGIRMPGSCPEGWRRSGRFRSRQPAGCGRSHRGTGRPQGLPL